MLQNTTLDVLGNEVIRFPYSGGELRIDRNHRIKPGA
jgi:hypothetical protein